MFRNQFGDPSRWYVSTGTRSQRWTMGQLQHRKNVSLKASLPTALR